MCITYSSISVYFQFLNIKMVVLKVLREFAAGTKIHGFAFLVSPKSSSRTKIIWAISLVVALSYASWEMRNSVISKYHYIFRAMKQRPMNIIKYFYVSNKREALLIDFLFPVPRPWPCLHFLWKKKSHVINKSLTNHTALIHFTHL